MEIMLPNPEEKEERKPISLLEAVAIVEHSQTLPSFYSLVAYESITKEDVGNLRSNSDAEARMLQAMKERIETMPEWCLLNKMANVLPRLEPELLPVLCERVAGMVLSAAMNRNGNDVNWRRAVAKRLQVNETCLRRLFRVCPNLLERMEKGAREMETPKLTPRDGIAWEPMRGIYAKNCSLIPTLEKLEIWRPSIYRTVAVKARA